MSHITLHKERGVNPRLTICTWCHKDVGLVLLGAREHIYRCTNCSQVSIGGRPGTPGNCVCPKCDRHDTYVQDRKIGEHEKINLGELCDDCAKKRAEHEAEVAAGGIYWRCDVCHSAGVLRATAELSKDVRKKLGIEPPKPCGVAFDKETCPVCAQAEKPTPQEA